MSKNLYLIMFSVVTLVGTSYVGIKGINYYIDKKSAEIVENTLADNTISHLESLTEVQLLLNENKISEASLKLKNNADTLKYILKNHCNLKRCDLALREY
ncbi:hypothetical protein RI845_12640 [Thalassotalea nanhaiensis]|uniref:DUF2570 domain-containing protein n=1 Tax=Thalassotalea nanhaiensis TaxID=3065648 RepID=A0ABY9TF09_9GAMM|nr:hypothetical protein RI845_12640 [Colwelliaceae bacterium SQ345]